jgi:hypothetical protein
MKSLYLPILSIFLFGCATTASTYKSGIKFEGENVKKNTFGYKVILDEKNRIEVNAGCGQYVEQAGMMSFIVPLPPIVPIGEKVQESKTLVPFSITITSWDGTEVPTNDMKITATIDEKVFDVQFVEKTVNELSPKILTYKFNSSATCGSIKNGTLQIEGFSDQLLKYKINFYEGTEWETSYLSS